MHISVRLPSCLAVCFPCCLNSCLPSFLPSFLSINRPLKMGRLVPTGNPAICQIRRIRPESPRDQSTHCHHALVFNQTPIFLFFTNNLLIPVIFHQHFPLLLHVSCYL